MTRKNSKKVSQVPLSNLQMLLLWVVLLGLTIVRLIVACSGSLGESEALLSVCAAHPAGGYIEGPCGVPLIHGVLLTFKPLLGGTDLIALRWFSPVAALLLSWCIWWIGRRIAPQNPSVALWSVVGFNLLPWVNQASLVMDGAMVTASLILLCIVAGWNAVDTKLVKGKQPLLPWLFFGAALGLGTLFFYPIGGLLPVAVVLRLRFHGMKSLHWLAGLTALVLLLLGGIVPLIWNARHDWIQWSSVAHGFDTYDIGGLSVSLSLCLAVSALLVPGLVFLGAYSHWWRRGMLLIFFGMAGVSLLVLAMPAQLPPNLPSPLGVQGVGELSRAVVSIQKERPDAKGRESFLIAQSPGLAAMMGEIISTHYPECPDSPPVFVAESPTMNSSYSLWPSYADALDPAEKDILYTEEKTVSPFLDRNALYITTEAPGELPQTITGAFHAVGLLKEMTLTKNGQAETIRIYQCEAYRALSL